MPPNRKKMRIEKAKEETDYLGNLPYETMHHVLTYLSYEETEHLRLMNKKLKAACDYRLKKAYLKVKQDVELCCEKVLHLKNNIALVSYTQGGFQNAVGKMFWNFVSEFLKTSFCLFDITKGYLDLEYSVNGKTIDVVRRILRLKNMEHPLYHLVESVIGRGAHCSKFKTYDDYGRLLSHWFNAKKDRGVDTPSIYLPPLDQREVELWRPIFCCQLRYHSAAAMLDILSTSWIGKNHIN